MNQTSARINLEIDGSKEGDLDKLLWKAQKFLKELQDDGLVVTLDLSLSVYPAYEEEPEDVS